MMGPWNGGMMSWSSIGILAVIFWIVLFVDSILLGIWLWQQIQRREKR